MKNSTHKEELFRMLPNHFYTSFRLRIKISKNSDVTINKDVKFDRKCFLTARGGAIIIDTGCRFNRGIMINADIGGTIRIGKDCIIGPGVILRTANHRFSKLDKPIRHQGHKTSDITLLNDVWLGANVVVLPGVEIGKGCVVGAGAVVTKSLPDYAIAVGVPARIIASRLNL